jgi:hypothetical protein
VTDVSRGMDRRTLIKGAALAGAAAWTAPMIIDSLSSPAAAVSVTCDGKAFNCSYANVVFTINGNGPYAVKIDGSGCSNDNHVSGGNNAFSYTCSNGTWSRCGSDQICLNGSVVPANVSACPITQNANGSWTANAGVLILTIAVHDGSCSSGGTHTCKFCGPATTVCFNAGSSSTCTPTGS